MPYLRLPRLRRDGPSRALWPQSQNAGLGVRRVFSPGVREGTPKPGAVERDAARPMAFSATFAARKRNAAVRGSSVRPHARSVPPRCRKPRMAEPPWRYRSRSPCRFPRKRSNLTLAVPLVRPSWRVPETISVGQETAQRPARMRGWREN